MGSLMYPLLVNVISKKNWAFSYKGIDKPVPQVSMVDALDRYRLRTKNTRLCRKNMFPPNSIFKVCWVKYCRISSISVFLVGPTLLNGGKVAWFFAFHRWNALPLPMDSFGRNRHRNVKGYCLTCGNWILKRWHINCLMCSDAKHPKKPRKWKIWQR